VVDLPGYMNIMGVMGVIVDYLQSRRTFKHRSFEINKSVAVEVAEHLVDNTLSDLYLHTK